MQVCHAYVELLCILVFNRLCCNVHLFFSCAFGVLKEKASLWVSHRLTPPFPICGSWRWLLLFFNAFQKSCNENPTCTSWCATKFHFRMPCLSGHLCQKHYKKKWGGQKKSNGYPLQFSREIRKLILSERRENIRADLGILSSCVFWSHC